MGEGKLEYSDIEKLKKLGTAIQYVEGDVIFSEGEEAADVYFVQTGDLTVALQEFNNRVAVGQLGAGDFFGEMAVLNNSRRSATVAAISDVQLVVLNKPAFLEVLKANGDVSDKIKQIMASRTEALALKENVLASTGLNKKNVKVAIAGDPSMRETAFDRERYESRVDKVLPELVEKLHTLLLERCVSEMYIQFNSSEIGLTSIFDPFNYEIHPVEKLIDDAYLDRHFPAIGYIKKANIIKLMYGAIDNELNNIEVPQHLKSAYHNYYQDWQPLAQEEIVKVLATLAVLRKIPNFYLRNFGISITRDTIRMQFNCDGTHIVSAQEYQNFLDENIDLSDN